MNTIKENFVTLTSEFDEVMRDLQFSTIVSAEEQRDIDQETLREEIADKKSLFSFYFSDGSKFTGPRDSVMYYASKFRDSLSKIEIKMDGWIPLHAEDKNEDWVSVDWAISCKNTLLKGVDTAGALLQSIENR